MSPSQPSPLPACAPAHGADRGATADGGAERAAMIGHMGRVKRLKCNYRTQRHSQPNQGDMQVSEARRHASRQPL